MTPPRPDPTVSVRAVRVNPLGGRQPYDLYVFTCSWCDKPPASEVDPERAKALAHEHFNYHLTKGE